MGEGEDYLLEISPGLCNLPACGRHAIPLTTCGSKQSIYFSPPLNGTTPGGGESTANGNVSGGSSRSGTLAGFPLI